MFSHPLNHDFIWADVTFSESSPSLIGYPTYHVNRDIDLSDGDSVKEGKDLKYIEDSAKVTSS